MVATPITTPVKKASASSRSKRWKSAALAMSITIETIASVASTAGVASPAPRRSETRITPVPVAMPVGEAEDARADGHAGRVELDLLRCRTLRSGTDAMTAPSTMLSERASSTL